MRDRLACWICNFVLRHLATKWYREMIGGAIGYGLKAAAKDTDWRRGQFVCLKRDMP